MLRREVGLAAVIIQRLYPSLMSSSLFSVNLLLSAPPTMNTISHSAFSGDVNSSSIVRLPLSLSVLPS